MVGRLGEPLTVVGVGPVGSDARAAADCVRATARGPCGGGTDPDYRLRRPSVPLGKRRTWKKCENSDDSFFFVDNIYGYDNFFRVYEDERSITLGNIVF